MRSKPWKATPEGNAQAMREMREADEQRDLAARRIASAAESARDAEAVRTP